MTVHPVPDTYQAKYGPAELEALNRQFESDPDGFWLGLARRLDWHRFPTQAGDWSYDAGDFHIRWFADGMLNVSVNCIDRPSPGSSASKMIAVLSPRESNCRSRQLTLRFS